MTKPLVCSSSEASKNHHNLIVLASLEACKIQRDSRSVDSSLLSQSPGICDDSNQPSGNRQILKVCPNFWVYLREANETIDAFQRSGETSIQHTICSCCRQQIVSIRDAEFVRCPSCCFTNLNGNQFCHGGGGLAVGVNLEYLH